MDGESHGGPHTGTLHPLVVVERTPLRSTVDEIIVDDQPAVLAYQFRPLVVVDQLPAPAFRADRLGVVLCLLLVLLYTLFQPVP
ncbi:MAG: hypothetical protein A4E39_00109 [Methanoregulaceae archaeon PtaB.Bin152]|nr:MAG: hypothetical protein A4E39_00109 [Methanoregulaceae archaeon PtaB.Bin152]